MDTDMSRLIILCGLIGSGKSHLSRQMQNYIRMSQDDLGGNRSILNRLFSTYVKQQENLIVDRTNINKSQRKWFLNQANEYEKGCIFLNTPKELCEERILARVGHPTLDKCSESRRIEILNRFFKDLEVPTLNEGFDWVITIKEGLYFYEDHSISTYITPYSFREFIS